MGGCFDHRVSARATSGHVVCANRVSFGLTGHLGVGIVNAVLSAHCLRDVHRHRNNDCNMNICNKVRHFPIRVTCLLVSFSASPRGRRGLVNVVRSRIGRVIRGNPHTSSLRGTGRDLLGSFNRGIRGGNC